jgi:undecaprenyl-diphosphatase
MRFAVPVAIALLAAVAAAALLLGGPESRSDPGILQHLHRGALAPAARLVTDLGAWWAVLIIGAVAAAVLARLGYWRRALVLLVLLLSQRVIVEQLKLFLDRARPDTQGHLVAVHSMAFPSGHSANAMTLGLGLALLLPLAPRGRRIALAAGLLYAFAIGISRPILGVHWPSDVVGGWAIGALWTLLLVRVAAGTSQAPRH